MKGKKTGGRKVGTPNKDKGMARPCFEMLIANNADKLQDWIDQIENPRDKLMVIIQLAKFVYPTPKSVDVNLTTSIDHSIEDALTALSKENE